jgi:hypothetical protein
MDQSSIKKFNHGSESPKPCSQAQTKMGLASYQTHHPCVGRCATLKWIGVWRAIRLKTLELSCVLNLIRHGSYK